MTESNRHAAPTCTSTRSRLEILGLAVEHHALVARLQREIIGPNLDEIIGGFYDVLLACNDTARFLTDAALVRTLERSQRHYLLTFGIDFDTDEYVSTRLRVGLAHARVGLPLSTYQCAYRRLEHLIEACIDIAPHLRPEERTALRVVCGLVASLDLAIGMEAYHGAEISALESSIDALRSEGEHLRHEATTDVLTGVANRKAIVTALEAALEESLRSERPLTLLLADLDHFKLVNDTYGHQVGDEVLRDAVGRMSAALRTEDVLGRYGGEEFMVVLAETKLIQGVEIANRMRGRLSCTPIVGDGRRIRITISIGAAEARPTDTFETFVGRADAALLAAKRKGRDRVAAFGHVAM